MDWLSKPRFLQKDQIFLLPMMRFQELYTDPDKVRHFGASIGR